MLIASSRFQVQRHFDECRVQSCRAAEDAPRHRQIGDEDVVQENAKKRSRVQGRGCGPSPARSAA
jgi:hypothetical protein